MANLPIRNVGTVGVITDVNAHDLPMNAFSDCANVIFQNNKVERAPVFKNTFSLGAFAGAAKEEKPVTTFSYTHPVNGAVFGIAQTDDVVIEYSGGVANNVTPTGIPVGVADETPWTSTEIAGLSVLCREVSEPYIKDPVASNQYSFMSVGDWPSSDRAVSMRGFKDFIIAMNVTESGVSSETKVKWCDALAYRQAVADVEWTPSASNLAGSNVLTDFSSPIVDGLALGNKFIIYSNNESAQMEYTGSSFVFSFKPLFKHDGVINKNCVANTGRVHYVFGNDDIYMHDGVTTKSLAQDRVKNRVYSEIDTENQSRCFVHYDNDKQLVYFCYKSAFTGVGFFDPVYCNRAAVFNITNNTWSFVDLPNCVGASVAESLVSSANYNQTTGNYTSTPGSYNTFGQEVSRISTFASIRYDDIGVTTSNALASDSLYSGKVNLPVNEDVIKPAFVERVGLDLDETQAPLRAYKQIRSIIPQISAIDSEVEVDVSLGYTTHPTETEAVYPTEAAYLVGTDYKIDSKANGRLVAYRVESDSASYFNFSAADIEVEVTGAR